MKSGRKKTRRGWCCESQIQEPEGQQFTAAKGSGDIGTSNCPLVQQQGPLLKQFDQQRQGSSQFGVGEDITGGQFMKTSIDSFQEL